MITLEELKDYFASLGITLPDAMLTCIVAKVNTAWQCMVDKGYSECDITLSLLIASALVGIGMGARKVASHSAGKVSQSYKYDSINDLQDLLYNNLAIYDPSNCTASVVPTKINSAFMFVASGCCK